MTDVKPTTVYDPSNPERRAWWMEEARQQVQDAMALPEGITLGWRRRCTSEACEEYDGIHCYGDGCALVRDPG